MKSRLAIRGPFVVVLALLLGACVSTTTGDLKSEPNNVDAAELNYTLGVRYFENGSYELARDRLLLAIELNPRLALAHTSLGQTYEALENPRLANEHYDKSVRIAPRNYDVQNAYAVFQCRNKNYDKAIVHFDKAIEHPENDNAHVTMTNAGMCMIRQAGLRQSRAVLSCGTGTTVQLRRRVVAVVPDEVRFERLSCSARIPATLHVGQRDHAKCAVACVTD